MKASLFLAGIAWLTTFVMVWLLYVDIVPLDLKRIVFLVMSFLVALFASVAAGENKDGDTG